MVGRWLQGLFFSLAYRKEDMTRCRQPKNQNQWNRNKNRVGKTYDKGKITAQADPSTLHSTGTNLIEQIPIPIMRRNEKPIGNQNRFAILGISLKKLDRSTSFTVADQVMLYENRWARMDWEIGIERPPKKKKLWDVSLCSFFRKSNLQKWNPKKVFEQCPKQLFIT